MTPQSIRNYALAASLAVFAASAAYAQHQHGAHGAGHQTQAKAAPTSESTRAYEAANAKMHKDMAIKFSGNADVDFVRGMIPHHQGAIDMAEVALKHGKDEWIRKLAQEVIAAQTREIAEMKAWLAKNAP